MKLRIHEIQDAGVVDTVAHIPADQIHLDLPDHPILVKPVETTIHAEAFEKEVQIVAGVTVHVRMPCSRCLEDYESTVSTGFEMQVSVEQTFVDVSDEVRQSILLAFPPKPLCREDCMGLCPHCGKNLNQSKCHCSTELEDTPFAKLKDLKTMKRVQNG